MRAQGKNRGRHWPCKANPDTMQMKCVFERIQGFDQELQRKTNSTQTLTDYLRILVPQFFTSQVIIPKDFASRPCLSRFPSSPRQPICSVTDYDTTSYGKLFRTSPMSAGEE